MDEVRNRLEAAVKDASQGLITNEFVAQYIDKVVVTITDDDTANLQIKIFTGKNCEKYLQRLQKRALARSADGNRQPAGRTGVTSKKMIQSYEQSMK